MSARGKQCKSCGKVGHFAKSRLCKGAQQVRNISIDNKESSSSFASSTEDAYVTLYSVQQEMKAKAPIGVAKLAGEKVQFAIDTGACETLSHHMNTNNKQFIIIIYIGKRINRIKSSSIVEANRVSL